jgi:hypothetical protein
MRKLLLLVSFSLLASGLFARVHKTPGILITKVDTIDVWFVIPLLDNGQVNYVALQHSIRVFRGLTDTVQATIRPAHIWQLEFDYGDEHIVMASTNNWMGFSYNSSKTDLLFLKIEEQGRATLCSYYNPAEFASAEDYGPRHYYILYQQHKTHQKLSTADYVYGLHTFFYDCKAIAERPEEEMAFQDIPGLVAQYNQYDCN